ncbi:MAG: WXG100 family type VII secretion target [Dermatophilaceae bacterium]
MTANLVHGDHVSCSRVGGGMRRESSRLHQHAQSLEDALGELAVWKGPEADAARPAIVASLKALRATADVLDEAGAALQRYATDLAQGHELGRRAELRVQSAGLLLDGTRVIEPWGPASAQESERRCGLVPEVQARVDLATAHVGRARGRLGRQMTWLAQAFSNASPVGPLASVEPLRHSGLGPSR